MVKWLNFCKLRDRRRLMSASGKLSWPPHGATLTRYILLSNPQLFFAGAIRLYPDVFVILRTVAVSHGFRPAKPFPGGRGEKRGSATRGTRSRYTSFTKERRRLPLFCMLHGEYDANQAQDLCHGRRSGGGDLGRGDGAICLSAGVRASWRRLPARPDVPLSVEPGLRRGVRGGGRGGERLRGGRSRRRGRRRGDRRRYRHRCRHCPCALGRPGSLGLRPWIYLLQRLLLPGPLARSFFFHKTHVFDLASIIPCRKGHLLATAW